VGAALTKPGCVSTARWRRPGERGREEYARNRCRNAPQRLTGSNLADLGRVRCVPAVGGELLGSVKPVLGEAMVKVCGEAVARPLGQSLNAIVYSPLNATNSLPVLVGCLPR
jgi:hypothetical protein